MVNFLIAHFQSVYKTKLIISAHEEVPRETSAVTTQTDNAKGSIITIESFFRAIIISFQKKIW